MKNSKRNTETGLDNPRRKDLETPRTVHLRPHSYQPNKAEKLAEFKINATPEELADAVLRPVRMIEDPDA